MRRFRVKAVSATDGVVFLDWKTDATDSQDALQQFLFMLEGALGSEYHIKGNFNVEVREIAQEPRTLTFPRPA